MTKKRNYAHKRAPNGSQIYCRNAQNKLMSQRIIQRSWSETRRRRAFGGETKNKASKIEDPPLEDLIWKIRDTICKHLYEMQTNGSRSYLPKGRAKSSEAKSSSGYCVCIKLLDAVCCVRIIERYYEN